MALLSESFTEEPAPLERSSSTRITGLDGIRGLAVVLVLVYHLWPSVLPGGFLGVTIFFALSGYLITRRLIEEREHTGHVALSAFYIRRARRLLPVAVGALGIIAVIWTSVGAMTREIRTEIGFGLLHLANWGQILSGQRYGASETSSPVIHFWSLAIEEQIYLVIPVVILLTSRGRLAIAFGLTIALSFALTLAAQGDPILVYYSTFTRAGEFLCGALLATVRIAQPQSGQGRRALLGLLMLGALVLAAAQVQITDSFLYSGGLLAAGGCAAIAVWATAGAPRYAALLNTWPLASLGRISYGLYLYHWPILIAVKMTGLSVGLTAWITLALTLVIASASMRWVEIPLQRSTSPISRLLAILALIGLFTFAVAALGTTRDRSIDFEATAARFELGVDAIVNESSRIDISGSEFAPEIAPKATPEVPAEIAVTEPLTISYFGDSKALTLAVGLLEDPPHDWRLGPSFIRLGCPLSRHGDLRSLDLGPTGSRALTNCDWMEFLRGTSPTTVDVLVIWFGTWDLTERRIPALGPQWLTIETPAYQDYLLEEIETLISAVREVLNPHVIVVITADDLHPAHPPGRSPHHHDLWERFISSSSHPLRVVDLVGWISETGEAERLRTDGIHLSFGHPDPLDNTAIEVHRRFLDPLLRELLAEQRRDSYSPDRYAPES